MKNNYYLKNLNCSKNRYETISDHLLVTNLVSALNNKSILVSSLLFSGKEKNKKVQLALFYRTQKLKEYKLKAKNNLVAHKRNISKVTKLFNDNNLNVKVSNLNLLLSEKEVLHAFEAFKTYANRLFQKRTSLFCDFLKLITLISNRKASVWSLAYIMALVFKPLQKKKHGMFVAFMNEIFTYLISQKDSQIKGVKMIISGRLKGKPRASLAKFSLGKISLTQQDANIESSQTHIYTIYGCFGLKLWINYK